MSRARRASLVPIITADMRRLVDHLTEHDGLPQRQLLTCFPVWTDRANHKHWTERKTLDVLRQCLAAGVVVGDNDGIDTCYTVRTP